jgi:hypothetical protein
VIAQAVDNGIEVVLSVDAQTHTFCHVLALQSAAVLSGATLPWAARVAGVDVCVGLFVHALQHTSTLTLITAAIAAVKGSLK